MLIDTVPGASNVAPSSEPTAAPSHAAKGKSSFAALLNAVAAESTKTASTEPDEDESASDMSMTVPVPVIVPIVPIVPVADVTDAQSATAIDSADDGRDTITSIETSDDDGPTADRGIAVPDAAAIAKAFVPDVLSKIEEKVEKPADQVSAEPHGAKKPPVEVVPETPEQGSAVSTKSPVSFVETTTPVVAEESKPAPATGKTEKAATPEAKTRAAAVKGTVPPAAPDTGKTASTPQAKGEIPATTGESAPRGIAENEPPPGTRGNGARLVRAIGRVLDPMPVAATATTDNGASANQNSNSQQSFGERLREQVQQLPQAAPGARAQMLASALNLVTPAHTDSRIGDALTIQAASAAAAPAATSLLPGEHDVTSQLVQSLRMQFRDGIGEAVLKLKPEHLGSVSISLKVENGGLKANVQAEMPAVRQWLESQQDTLRSALADHGLRLDRFEVEPDGQQQAQPDDPRGEEAAQRRRQQRRLARQMDSPVFEVVV